jgi:DNA-binding CsgD family transcriptional regulator
VRPKTEEEIEMLDHYRKSLAEAKSLYHKALAEEKPDSEVRIARGMIRSLEWTIALLEHGGENSMRTTLVEPDFFERFNGEASTDPFDVLYGDGDCPSWEVEQKLMEKKVKKALTKNERVVLEAYLSGMSLREIAGKLGLNYSSVRAYVRRANTKLENVDCLQATLLFEDRASASN